MRAVPTDFEDISHVSEQYAGQSVLYEEKAGVILLLVIQGCNSYAMLPFTPAAEAFVNGVRRAGVGCNLIGVEFQLLY